MRWLVLLLVLGCGDDRIRAINPTTGEIASFAPGAVPPGWEPCPGDKCPDPYPCHTLGEADCGLRGDCKAVVIGDGPTPTVSCVPGDPPPNVCAEDGESCKQVGCCAGLGCCSGVPVPPGAEYCGQLCPISDRNRKHAIVRVDPDDILAKLAKLPVATWTYNFEPGVRHMGPMAQDFAASFGLGATDRRIFTVDADGVALASIQGLLHRVETLDRENAALRTRLDALERRIAGAR